MHFSTWSHFTYGFTTLTNCVIFCLNGILVGKCKIETCEVKEYLGGNYAGLKIIITKCYNIIYNSSSFLSDLLNNDFRLGNIFNEEKCPDSLWLRQRLTVNVNKILVKEASFKERVTKRGKILVKVKKSQSSAGRLWESYGWTVEDVWEYLKNVMCWSKEEVLEEFNSLRMWGCWRL